MVDTFRWMHLCRCCKWERRSLKSVLLRCCCADCLRDCVRRVHRLHPSRCIWRPEQPAPVGGGSYPEQVANHRIQGDCKYLGRPNSCKVLRFLEKGEPHPLLCVSGFNDLFPVLLLFTMAVCTQLKHQILPETNSPSTHHPSCDGSTLVRMVLLFFNQYSV